MYQLEKILQIEVNISSAVVRPREWDGSISAVFKARDGIERINIS